MPGNNLFQLRRDIPSSRSANSGTAAEPRTLRVVTSLNTDGVGDDHRDRGSASSIDVSGDSLRGNLRAGMVPTHAGLIAASTKLYIANSGDDTLTANNVSDPNAVLTISLPPSPFASLTLCSGDGTTATYTYTAASQQFFAGDTVYVSGCAANGLNGSYTVTAQPVRSRWRTLPRLLTIRS